MKISICIPTYNRPDLLKLALESCLSQTLLPHEFVISDDSNNDETELLIRKLSAEIDIPIKYFHNRPSLKQVANVNNLFNNTETELLILLHDDDTLSPNAVEDLYTCFVNNLEIGAAFGKQYIMDFEGNVNYSGSEKLNKDFYKSTSYKGMVLSSLESGLLSQFPNNGYMIRTEIAKNVLYSESAGDACDYEFGLRLGVKGVKMFFVDVHTTYCRISLASVSKTQGNNAALNAFKLIEKVAVPPQSNKYKDEVLESKAALAIVQAAESKDIKKAIDIFFSKWHRKRIFNPAGIKRALRVFLASIK